MSSSYQDHSGMTLKQKLFCQHYLSNGYNGTQAAKSAGYGGSDLVCGAIATENLKKPLIKKYIGEIVNEEIEKAGVGVSWRLKMVKDAMIACSDGSATKEGYVHAEGIFKGADLLNKMDGSYAPTQTESKVSVEEVDHSKADHLIKTHEKPV